MATDLSITTPAHCVPTAPLLPPPPPGFRRRAALMGSLAAMLAAPELEAAMPSINADAKLLRLCAEFNERERRVHALYDGPGAALDDDSRDALIAPLIDDQRDLLDEIVEIPATTSSGLIARIEMIALYAPDILEPCDWKEEMVAAIVRDGMLLRAGGAA